MMRCPLIATGFISLVLLVVATLEAENFFKSGGVMFKEVTAQAGLNILTKCGTLEKKFIVEGNGSGCAWIDYDNDGWTDLYIVNGLSLENLFARKEDGTHNSNFLFHNNGNGTFTDVTEKTGVSGSGLGNGVVAADYNNDGFIDLFVTNYGPNILYKNNGNGTFTNVAKQANVAGDGLWSTGATFGDYDRDGWVDLYVARYVEFDVKDPPLEGEFCSSLGLKVMCGPLGLPGSPDVLYRSNGDGTFADVTRAAGVEDKRLGYGYSAVFEDLDNDGFPDLFVTNDSGPNYLYHNQKNGRFKEVGLLAGVAFNREGRAQANMGIAVGDLGHDGLSDLFVTTFSDDYYPLFHNRGNLKFEETSREAGLEMITRPFLGWAAFFFDFDNDGTTDLFTANGHLFPQIAQIAGNTYRQQNLLFRGEAPVKFKDVSAQTGISDLLPKSSRGAAYCDFDNDGDLDLIALAIDDAPVVLRNDGGNRGNWLQLRLVGKSSNRSAIGASVKVVSDGVAQYGRIRSGGSYLSQSDLRLHFGLSDHTRVDLIEIDWPSGYRQRLHNIKANSILSVTERDSK